MASFRRLVPFTVQFQGRTPFPFVSDTSNTWVTFSPNSFDGKTAIPLLPLITGRLSSIHCSNPARTVASGLCAYTMQVFKKSNWYSRPIHSRKSFHDSSDWEIIETVCSYKSFTFVICSMHPLLPIYARHSSVTFPSGTN